MDAAPHASPGSPLDLLTSLLSMQQSSRESAQAQLQAIGALAHAIEHLAQAIDSHAAALRETRTRPV